LQIQKIKQANRQGNGFESFLINQLSLKMKEHETTREYQSNLISLNFNSVKARFEFSAWFQAYSYLTPMALSYA